MTKIVREGLYSAYSLEEAIKDRKNIGAETMKKHIMKIVGNFQVNNLAYEMLCKIRSFLLKALPSNETDVRKIKDDIWTDLSDLYYKYEDSDQKRAFREVTREISEKIIEGRWQAVYQKLYRTEKMCSSLHVHACATGG